MPEFFSLVNFEILELCRHSFLLIPVLGSHKKFILICFFANYDLKVVRQGNEHNLASTASQNEILLLYLLPSFLYLGHPIPRLLIRVLLIIIRVFFFLIKKLVKRIEIFALCDDFVVVFLKFIRTDSILAFFSHF